MTCEMRPVRRSQSMRGMHPRCPDTCHPRIDRGPLSMDRRGGILLETLIAVAVFTAAAALLLRTSTEAIAALDVAERRSMAVDLARSAIARLEAGAVNLTDLRAGRVTPEGEAPALEETLFRVQVATRRSAFTGLTVVEVAVHDREASADAAPLAMLRQLVELRREDAEPE